MFPMPLRQPLLLFLAVTGLMLTALTVAGPARAGVTATIDRDHVALDETLTLTITRDESSFFSDPDLDPLAKDFKVLDSGHSSNTQIVNGHMSASVQWQVTLAPKRTGRLWIPPIKVGDDATAPLSVTVTRQAQPNTRADQAPLFIETEVDRHQAMVQEQILFTLRVYWAIQAQIDEPDDPHLGDALLERLDDSKFTKTINGQEFQVFERRYAIFPQQSGTLVIPQMTVHAVVVSPHGFGGFGGLFDPFGQQGQEIKLRSREERITVSPKPAGYPDAPWLPSSGFTVSREWSQPPDQLKVGDSATLTITTTGEGLLAAQLPPIMLAEPAGIKLYQNKPELENRKTASGITGVRRDSIALIPTRAGSVALPEIRIPWWNKKKGQVETAVLPAQNLVVRGASPQAAAPPPAAPAPSAAAPPPAAPAAPATLSSPAAPAVGPAWLSGRVWPVACGLLAVAWLATLFLWHRERRQRMIPSPAMTARATAPCGPTTEKAAHAALTVACRADDPRAARQALIRWAQARWPERNIRVAADLERIHPDPGLQALLGEMDSALYGREQHSDQWNGMRLLAMVDQLRAATGRKDNKETGLPPVYGGEE